MLNSTLLENSDFYTGAFPAEYGNALSGVFDLKMRKGNNEKYEFLGQAGFNGFELGAEGPLSKNSGSSFLINYRYSTLGLFSKLGMDFGAVGVPEYQDLAFKLTSPTPNSGIYRFSDLGHQTLKFGQPKPRWVELHTPRCLGYHLWNKYGSGRPLIVIYH